MPLDPDVRALLDLFVAAGRPPVWQVTPDEAREGMNALARAVDVKDEPIARRQAIVAPGPAGAIECRLYTPSAAGDGAGPGIVYFHGGGFVIGSLDTHDGICRMLANGSTCRVLSVAYRLAPEHRFPAAVEDAVAATAWAMRNAAMLGIDPSRLAVAGDSAGGTLAAVVAQRVPGIALQVLLCPTTDRRADTPSRRDLAEGYFLERASMDWFFGHYVPPGTDPADPRLSPARAADLACAAGADPHRRVRPLARRGQGLCRRARRRRRFGALHLPRRDDPSFLRHGRGDSLCASGDGRDRRRDPRRPRLTRRYFGVVWRWRGTGRYSTPPPWAGAHRLLP
jgi:acetyl esterase